jgi:site-specific DNA-methyltransferase (adenine-specific)
LLGDNLAILPTLFPDDSVDAVIYSAPYHLQRKYNGLGNGNETDFADYLAYLLALFEESLRIVKPSGCVIVNLGDKRVNGSQRLLPYRFALAVLDRFEVKLVNDVTWYKPNGIPKVQDSKWLANHTEQFFVFAKSDDYYFDPKPFKKKKAARSYAPSPRLGQQYRRQIEASDLLSNDEKRNAQLELDQLVQEVKDGKIKGFRMKIRGIHALPFRGPDGGASRRMIARGFHVIRLRGLPVAKNLIEHAVDSRKGGLHPAVFPVRLIEKFVIGFCPIGGIVVDHCMGSGSLAVAALNTGRRYIGVERDPVYHADSIKTLKAHPQSKALSTPATIDPNQSDLTSPGVADILGQSASGSVQIRHQRPVTYSPVRPRTNHARGTTLPPRRNVAAADGSVADSSKR